MKENKLTTQETLEKNLSRNNQNRLLAKYSSVSVKEVLETLDSSLTGLDEHQVNVSRIEYGSNKVTKEKKKSLPQRLAGAFINPFTAILFCLAIVSTITDMILPYFSLFGSEPEDFDCLTVIIILTMVVISGTLRFVQETRSGNSAEKLLAMITTKCTVTRKGHAQIEIPLDDVVYLCFSKTG